VVGRKPFISVGAVGIAIIFFACVGETEPVPASTPEGGTSPTTDGPAPTTEEASIEDGSSKPRCDPTKQFANSRPMPNLNVADHTNEFARLSPDELTVYFSRKSTSGTSTTDFDVYVATRSTRSADFGVPLPLNGGNTPLYDRRPSPTADGLFIYAHGPGGGGDDIVVASRPNSTSPFSTFTALGNIATPDPENTVYVLPDQSALFYEGKSQTDAAVGGADIYRRGHTGGGVFGVASLVGGVNTLSDETAPVVIRGEHVIYFASNRNSVAPINFSIHVARRTTTATNFDAPQAVTELNTPEDDFPTWVSEDECVILFTHRLAGATSYELRIAERPL
jgi:hypothetical protein